MEQNYAQSDENNLRIPETVAPPCRTLVLATGPLFWFWRNQSTPHLVLRSGFHTGICSGGGGGGGGGKFVSGEQWACEACLPRGGLGVPPIIFFERVSALRLIQVGFGNQALTTVVIAPVPKLPVKSGTGDCGYRYR